MEKLFELFNQKEYSSLLKRKLDYVSSLYEDCRNSNEYSIVREIVENFSEIILILEKNEKTNDIIKSEHKANDDYPNFPSLDNLVKGQQISDNEIISAFDDYMTRDALFNHCKQPSELTIKDYIKRLRRYAREYGNGITILELYENIEFHINGYFNNPEKLERNKKQHGGELSALKKLYNMKVYINDIHRKEDLKKYLTKYLCENLNANPGNDVYDQSGSFDFLTRNAPLTQNYLTIAQKEMILDKIKNKQSFFDTISKIIDDRNLTDSYVYNKAGVKRNVFSRMRKGEHPSKETALMLALALDLDYDDFQYLLSTAGYSLSTEDEKEVIIKAMFDINKGNIDDINEALYLLGYKTLRNAEE
jgi:hypothetical protein